jgi:hypothetical protein
MAKKEINQISVEKSYYYFFEEVPENTSTELSETSSVKKLSTVLEFENNLWGLGTE